MILGKQISNICVPCFTRIDFVIFPSSLNFLASHETWILVGKYTSRVTNNTKLMRENKYWICANLAAKPL